MATRAVQSAIRDAVIATNSVRGHLYRVGSIRAVAMKRFMWPATYPVEAATGGLVAGWSELGGSASYGWH